MFATRTVAALSEFCSSLGNQMMNRLFVFFVTCVLSFALHIAHAQPYTSDQALHQLRVVIAQYQDIVAAGGWSGVPRWSDTQTAPTDAQRQAVKQRLLVSGDWLRGAKGISADQQFENAIRQFQARHGVLANGELNAQTIAVMNVSAFERLQQLKAGLIRALKLADEVDSERYVLVNIPAQELVAVSGGSVELTSAVIVGHSSRPTPAMQGRIRGVTFHPVWNVPLGIARKDFYPLLRKNPGYFERQNIQILQWSDGKQLSAQQVVDRGLAVEQIRFRRGPDLKNPLGRVRIDMPNAQAIYLHDTPSTPMFGWPDRSFSSGCVRVSRVVELASWVLRGAQWSPLQTTRALKARQTLQVRAESSVPVHLAYLTAWANELGQAQFRDDLYGLENHSEKH